MEGRGFGFVTFQDPTHAQSFLEVRVLVSFVMSSTCCFAAAAFMLVWYSGGFLVLVTDTSLCNCMQTRQHMIDGKKVEAKAAVPRNSGSGNSLTKKMFVGGTVRLALAFLNAHTIAVVAQQPLACPLCEKTHNAPH